MADSASANSFIGQLLFREQPAQRRRFDLCPSRPKPADADYWLKVNVPVILIVHDPKSGHGYWIDVKKYAAQHPEFPSTSVVRFSLRSNLLSADSILDLSETA